MGTIVNGKPIDLGDYINADDIAQLLKKKGKYSFSKLRLKLNNDRFKAFSQSSGLLKGPFSEALFVKSYRVIGNSIQLLKPEYLDQIAQLIARFLREEMLRLKRRFSFETVFSHSSNLDIMVRARDAGYKVYLYFV